GARAQIGELPSRVVRTVGRICRQDEYQPELVAGWPLDLALQDLGDLARPEELAFEVDEPLRRPERPHVGLENPKVPSGNPAVDVLRHRADDLHLDVPGPPRPTSIR